MNVVPNSGIASWTHDREYRERNKSLRQIYEDEGLDYGNDVSAAELNSRMASAVKLRQASVAKMFKILNASRNIQLCFLVDVTGSMRNHIDGIRNSIFKIVEKLTEKHVTFAGHSAIAKKISLAFVGYRDSGLKNPFELLPFTESVEDFRQFCSKIDAYGAPEDVFGGLEKAIFDLNWSDISMCTKIIFHIADDPCHGKKYHSSDYPRSRYSNIYPNGDPNGRTAESLFNALRVKGIQYHFGKIISRTDKIIEMFSDAIGSEIEVSDIKNVDRLVDCVVSSVSIARANNPRAMIAKQHVFKIDRTVPNFSKLPTLSGVFISYKMPGNIDEVINGIHMDRKHPIKAKIQMAEHPFAHGSERNAFYGRDMSSNSPTEIVLKEYIRENTDTGSRSTATPYEIATQMQTIAAYLASIFTDRLQKMDGIVHNIKFLKAMLLSIEIKPGENRYMSCERRYGSDSKFLRFSNNADYAMLETTCKVHNLKFDVVELLMAFSHWTYQITGGFLMVVDLQGIISTDERGRKTLELTDPAIHCKDLTRFGGTNLGLDGMKSSFNHHVCNKFCAAMELKPPGLTASSTKQWLQMQIDCPAASPHGDAHGHPEFPEAINPGRIDLCRRYRYQSSCLTETKRLTYHTPGSECRLERKISWMNVVPNSGIASWSHERENRERNKSLRQIYDEEGLDYGNDVSAAELKSRMSNAVKLRQASVAKMFKILNESRKIQLCFLVDVTGSMSKYIDGIRNSIFKIVEKLTEKHVTVAGHNAIAKKVSLAFVGYRDFGYKNQFELLSFTENAEDFRQFCSQIRTHNCSNRDSAEDVFGGLEKAICDLSWSDTMYTKIIFHIADHPCHGRKYHTARYIDKHSDNFPDGDPNGRTAESLFNSLREKGIQYHFGKIQPHTDRMIELFSEAMGNEIEVFDVKEIEKLVDCVVSSVSIGTSIHPAMRAKQQILKIVKAIPDWSKLPIFYGVFISYKMPGNIDEVISGIPMDRKHPTKAKIQIAEHPFAHGAERKAFYGRDMSSNSPTEIVLKEYIRENTDTGSRSTATPYEIATQMQTIAAYLAYTFTDSLQTMSGIVYDIKFLEAKLLSIEIKPGENRYMSCERRYGSDSKFLRFSNNADYAMLETTCKVHNLKFDVVELLMAFSHWTYQISHGYLMVVDLQGIKSTDENGRTILELTDPAIHCTDLTRFGRTNLRQEGMKIFFAHHKCNKFCQSMELEKHDATTL
ncbi:alpha-kinase family domain-containing protein [Ditylenchus destructor]|uniref:Alpha-kinase family domain-containing protein n=1 Tax=Ditylenchus destructor TaxID=166010 RepID=A0AAD4QX67_9BILA|nr:alpha-kinase family domain-containing protein [Ditylenchus destructor]